MWRTRWKKMETGRMRTWKARGIVDGGWTPRASGQSADTSAVPDYVATSLITRQPATILDPTAWNEKVRGPSSSRPGDGEGKGNGSSGDEKIASPILPQGWVVFRFTNVDTTTRVDFFLVIGDILTISRLLVSLCIKKIL